MFVSPTFAVSWLQKQSKCDGEDPIRLTGSTFGGPVRISFPSSADTHFDVQVVRLNSLKLTVA